MITLEQFSLSLAMGLILAFVAGAGFGVWLTLRCLNRIYTEISTPKVTSPISGQYEIKLTTEEAEEIKKRVKQDNGPNTFERTPP